MSNPAVVQGYITSTHLNDTSVGWTILWTLTQRGLQHVSIPLTGSNGLDVQRVHQPPEVVGVITAVETQA